MAINCRHISYFSQALSPEFAPRSSPDLRVLREICQLDRAVKIDVIRTDLRMQLVMSVPSV